MGCEQEEPPFYRSIEYERGATRQAALGSVDPTRLILQAEVRAAALASEHVNNHMTIARHRNRIADVRKELADARNHLVWAMQERIEDELFIEQALGTLRFIILAYDFLKEEG